jgi:hypothetical protein
MKRGFLLLVLVTVITGAAFTQALHDNSEQEIDTGEMFIYAGDIPLIISPFSTEDAEKAQNRKWVAFTVNLIAGFGIGSFIQGDIDGGVIGLCGELAGMTLMVLGTIRMAGIWVPYVSQRVLLQNLGLIAGGSILWTGTRIFEVVRPFTYARRLSIELNPDITVNGQPAVTAMVRLSLD